MIYILDYGAGNLKSAFHAFESLYPQTMIVDNVNQIKKDARGLVLPGDGSFPFAFKTLKERGFVNFIKQNRNLPLLGICVGFQLLFSGSTEDSGCEGLDLIPGKVIRFSEKNLKIPHMGWNTICLKQNVPCTDGIKDNDYFYFVHSYYPDQVAENAVLMLSDYGHDFCAAVHKDNIYGFQFHPEKSHAKGIRIIKNFITICRDTHAG